MIIEFVPEAGDSYNTAVSAIEGYRVAVTGERVHGSHAYGAPATTGRTETFDATILGVDHEAGWYGTLRVQELAADSDEKIGTPFSVVAEKLVVY